MAKQSKCVWLMIKDVPSKVGTRPSVGTTQQLKRAENLQIMFRKHWIAHSEDCLEFGMVVPWEKNRYETSEDFQLM